MAVQYAGWNADEAVSHYIMRMKAKIPHFETMNEKDLNYIKAGRPTPARMRTRPPRPAAANSSENR